MHIIEGFINEKNNISFINAGVNEPRRESTIKIFKESFGLIKDSTQFRINNFAINTHDISYALPNKATFGYTCADMVIPCPDFTFDKWEEIGIAKYETKVESIITAGNKEYLIDKLFWIGALSKQQLRYKLFDLGELYNHKLEIISMDLIKDLQKGERYTHSLSLEDHTKYKYLLDCGDFGWSARLKFLLFTNRPLFLVERERDKRDFFYDLLVPYKHYIPVWSDLSNLISQIEWADNNYSEAKAIAVNARKFAMDNLNKDEVIMYLANLLRMYLS